MPLYGRAPRPVLVTWRRGFLALCAVLVTLSGTTVLYAALVFGGNGARSAGVEQASSNAAAPPPTGLPPPVPLPQGTARAREACGDTFSPLLLVRGGELLDPSPRGRVDVLCASGGAVLALLPGLGAESDQWAAAAGVRVVDATGLVVCPGLVDIHVHVVGGGGEAGPESQTPGARVSELLQGGLTTVVGVLGTDSVTRTPAELLAKANALNRDADGAVTAFMMTGAYATAPVPTVTGSVQRDVALLPPCVGVGEAAISDARGSQPSRDVLARIAADARVGGLLGGKGGVTYFHVGPGNTTLAPLWDLVRSTPIPQSSLLPTHVHRSEALVADAAAWIASGGFADVNANSRALPVLDALAARGGPDALSRVSVSSDAYGSLPRFDSVGKLLSYDYARPDRLVRFLAAAVRTPRWSLARALPLVTTNPARFLGLPRGKGVVALGGDADLTIFNGTSADLHYVVGAGRVVLTPTCVKHGMMDP